jgi:hypothetical protein
MTRNAVLLVVAAIALTGLVVAGCAATPVAQQEPAMSPAQSQSGYSGSGFSSPRLGPSGEPDWTSAGEVSHSRGRPVTGSGEQATQNEEEPEPYGEWWMGE